MRMMIATGGAPHSTLALETGLRLAPPDAEIHLLSVAAADARRAHAARILAAASRRAQQAGFAAQTCIYVGRTAEEIVRAARKTGSDLIVIGERPRHRLRARLLGSVTTHVVEHAHCAVLVAKGTPRPLRRVLICDSGGGQPSVIRLYAGASWLQRMIGDAQVRLLHVMSQIAATPGVPAAQLTAGAAELMARGAPEGRLLAEDLAYLQAAGLRVEPLVRHGLVADEILAEMRDGDYDLIIIGAHRPAGWQRYLLTDLARVLVTRSDRPILLLRAAV